MARPETWAGISASPQHGVQLLDDLGDVGGARAGRLRHARDQLAVLGRLEVAERQILELDLHPLDAEAVGQRRVDLQRLARDALLLLARHVLQRAHVVDAIGELDQDDADVARHRQQHLAEVLGLALLARGPGDLAQLGHALDQELDLGAEQAADVLGGGAGVLDAVVQQAGADRRHVQAQLGDDAGHAHRVDDVGLARAPPLAGVALGGEVEAALDEADVGGGVVAANELQISWTSVIASGAARACAPPPAARARWRAATARSGPPHRWMSVP